jgi:hypothetical protein
MQVGGGVLIDLPHRHVTTHSPPSLQMRVGGVSLVSTDLPRRHPTPPPSLQMRVRGVVSSHHPPISPPSLQTRVGGVVLNLQLPHHHPFPLPRFKRELEGSSPTIPPPVPLPHFKRESEGSFLVFTHHTTIHSLSLTSNASQRGVFSLHPPHHHHFPSLASNASRRGHLNLQPPLHHLFPLPRFKCESEGVFLVFTHTPPPIPPSSLQMRVGGGVFIQSSPTTPPIPPPSLQTQVGGGVFYIFFILQNNYNILSKPVDTHGTLTCKGKPVDTCGYHHTLTCKGYGVHGYGYRSRKKYPGITRVIPYTYAPVNLKQIATIGSEEKRAFMVLVTLFFNFFICFL